MSWLDKLPIIALAPLADHTDSPFCRICREVSGQDFVVFREMVSSEALVRDSAKTLKMCQFEEIERPIVIQIFGSDPATIREAARLVVDKFKPDGIDINMGCPVPKIAGKNDAGASLMKDPNRAVKIVQELKKENLGVPLSVKTRLGWSRVEEILEFAPRLAEAGVDALTVHGRTKVQGYEGKANWDMIGQVKKILTIPVIANGDIQSETDIKNCLEQTGADGVMIGRGALGNPWIFNNYLPGVEEIKQIVLKHAKLHLAHYGEGSMTTFRKHLVWYFKGDRFPNQKISLKEIRMKLVKVNTIEELRIISASF